MSTATLEATEVGLAREKENFRLSAGIIDRVVRLNADGLTQADSMIQPQPAGNCMNWVVGHLVAVYDRALQLLGQEPVMGEGALQRYGRGVSPLTKGEESIEFSELMDAWREAAKRVDFGIGSLTSERLEEPAPFSPTGKPDETVRSLLTAILFHQAYHTGQMGLLRRIAGKANAIS